MITVARITLWLVAGVLAVMVAASSAAIAYQVKHPRTSAAIGIGPMGQVKANLAFASYATRQKQDQKALISGGERGLALAAYQREPLSSAALGILIASTDRAEATKRQALLDLGGKLTRRSSLITSASIEAAALRGDDASFFLWLSRAIVTDETLRATYISAMARATAMPAAVSTLAPVIGSQPSWADRYWNAVAGVPESLDNAARLRAAVARAPWRQAEISDADRRLARSLARHGQFDALRQMSAALNRSAGDRAPQEILVNADFSRQSVMPPIDWDLASSGNLGATIEPERKLLSISAIAGARGYAARQLIELVPGTYELTWKLASDTGLEKGVMAARIECAEKGGGSDTAQSADLGLGAQRVNITVADERCRWYWFSVEVNVPDMSAGIDTQFRYLNLKRVD